MKRTNYADPEMDREIKEMRRAGIRNFWCTARVEKNGRIVRFEDVLKHTAQGISMYANKMYKKYEESLVDVEVWYVDKNCEIVTYCTYR